MAAKRVTSDTTPKPVRGTTLRIGLVQPVSFDPARTNEASFAQLTLADLLHDGLTDWDDATHELRPGLAETWSASADGLRWTSSASR